MDELLQIRRDLDDLAENWIGGMFEDGFSARQMAVKELRNSLNDTVAANAPKGLDVKADLAKQSHILAARDIAHPRMHAQKRNHLTRWLKNLEQATGFSHPTTPLGAAANATSILSAGPTATLAMGYGLHRPMTAAARASYHRALKSIEALQKTGVDQAMLTEGKLAILDILKSNPVADDVEE